MNQRGYQRERLHVLLDNCLKLPVTWISGPGGCGKSTLVTQYLDLRALPALWYQVTERDADDGSFLCDLEQAAKSAGFIDDQALPLTTPDVSKGLALWNQRRFRDFFSVLDQPTVVVFSDVHAAGDISNFLQLFSSCLEDFPSEVRIIVISRDSFPAGLARIRSRRLVGEISWDDLRLTLKEAVEIAELVSREVREEEIRRIHTQTNGWIAGFVLFLRHRTPPVLISPAEPLCRVQPSSPFCTIQTLGRFELLLDGEPLRFSRKAPTRTLDLLKFLVAQGRHPVHLDVIISCFWPDASQDAALNSLTIALHRLRKLFGTVNFLTVKDGVVSLDERFVRVDAWEFEQLLVFAKDALVQGDEATAITLIRRAVTLYRGHFLPGDCNKSWSVAYRDRLQSKFNHNMGTVCRHHVDRGELQQAIACYQDGLDIDHLTEDFYQQLMLCYYKAGLYAEAAVVYDCCRKNLAINLAISPSPKTVEIYRMITT